MSDMSRERVRSQMALPFPPVPDPFPPFCEGNSHPFPTRSQSPYPFPFPALYSGNGERVTDGMAVTGTHRRAHIRVCRCHSPILAGLDANVAALSVAVDPYPLTPAGEVEALRDHRRTYVLLRGELDRRDAWTIPGHPPSPSCTVLAEHRCEARVPDDWKAPPAPATAPRPEETF